MPLHWKINCVRGAESSFFGVVEHVWCWSTVGAEAELQESATLTNTTRTTVALLLRRGNFQSREKVKTFFMPFRSSRCSWISKTTCKGVRRRSRMCRTWSKRGLTLIRRLFLASRFALKLFFFSSWISQLVEKWEVAGQLLPGSGHCYE